jgi:cellulose biosynthesis protein BcsQ
VGIIPTLLWDLDPQGAASWYLAGTDEIKGRKLAALMDGKTPIGKFIRASAYPDLDFIPAHNSFRNLDVRLDKDDSANTLKNWLAPLSEETSLVVLDCPPSMSRLSEQVLKTADGVFVPVVPTWLALNSWQQLQSFAKDKKLKPGRLHPFFSIVDRRKNLHREMVIHRKQRLENGLNALIPNASVVEKMGESGQPVELMDRSSAAADAYRRLWKEIRKLI